LPSNHSEKEKGTNRQTMDIQNYQSPFGVDILRPDHRMTTEHGTWTLERSHAFSQKKLSIKSAKVQK
jgi:hypothetical protein